MNSTKLFWIALGYHVFGNGLGWGISFLIHSLIGLDPYSLYAFQGSIIGWILGNYIVRDWKRLREEFPEQGDLDERN